MPMNTLIDKQNREIEIKHHLMIDSLIFHQTKINNPSRIEVHSRSEHLKLHSKVEINPDKKVREVVVVHHKVTEKAVI